MRLILLAAIAIFAVASMACAAEIRNGGGVRVRSVGAAGRLLGFDVIVGERVIAPVRLSSNGLITGGQVRAELGETENRLTILGLAATGVAFAPDDSVSVVLEGDDPYPRVEFRLRVEAFDAEKWQDAAGTCPFHFLACSMPAAEAWHQRGWLNATPKSDPFPLLLDVHVGKPEISCQWNRNWGYICPVGAHPIPVIGLWAPQDRLYVGYDFTDARLGDHSERYVATAYCWEQGADSQFITLAYPHGGDRYGELVYPEPPADIESHFRIIYSTDMPGERDPNRFYQGLLFERHRDALPTVPVANDMSWVAKSMQMNDFYRPPGPGLYVRLKNDIFAEDGTAVTTCWWRNAELPVESAYARNDQVGIDRMKADLEYLLGKAKRFTVAGDECLYWEHPVEGQWKPEWGGKPVVTLHNCYGWSVGMAIIDLYRHERDPALLPIIDGIYNWTRHNIWTRNEFWDVPSSPFAIGGTTGTGFLLDYYLTFKHDPDRAAKALDMALSICWRYMPIWACDNDPYDNLDSSFLLEPNSGRDWAGLACANEVHWVLDMMTQVYVHTGDERLAYYLRGALDRWHLLYREECHPTLDDYPRSAMTEGLGFFDGCGPGRGERYTFGTGSELPLHWPIGEATARLVCGEKAAFVTYRGRPMVWLAHYAYEPEGNLRFFLGTTADDRIVPFDVALTVPFVNIADKAVAVVSMAGGGRRALPADRIMRLPHAPSSVYLRGVVPGELVLIGDIKPIKVGERSAGPPSLPEPKRGVGRFTTLELSKYEATGVPVTWSAPDSFAGLPLGRRWFYGVPCDMTPTTSLLWRVAVAQRMSPQMKGANRLFVLWSPRDEGKAAITVSFDRGAPAVLKQADCARAWRAWPPCFTRELFIGSVEVPAGRKATQIEPRNALIFAVTAWVGERSHPELKRVLAALNEGIEAYHNRPLAGASLGEIRALAKRVPAGRIAILPPGAMGRASVALCRSGIAERAVALTREQFVDPAQFNAERFPVALYLAGETYVKTVHRSGDGQDAIRDFLASGGLLVLLPSGPYPMYYGDTPGAGKADPLLPELGVPIRIVFEEPPEGAELRLKLNRKQRILGGVPASFDFPSTADLRLRAIDPRAVPRWIRYTPLLSVVDDRGIRYGDAAAYLEFSAGPLKGGRILYIWGRLLTEGRIGGTLLEQALTYAMNAAT